MEPINRVRGRASELPEGFLGRERRGLVVEPGGRHEGDLAPHDLMLELEDRHVINTLVLKRRRAAQGTLGGCRER